MITSLTKIGNSKGIIIPANILKQFGFKDEVSLEITEDALIIKKPKTNPREGWEEQILAAGVDDDEEVFMDGIPNDFDDEEWTW